MQLHCPCSAAWQHYSAHNKGNRVVQAFRQPIKQLHKSRCFSTPADGDVVRPSAQAAPVSPPLADVASPGTDNSSAPAQHTSTSGHASGVANGKAGGSGSVPATPRNSSYSKFYKALNSTQYSLQAAAQPSRSSTQTSSSSSNGTEQKQQRVHDGTLNDDRDITSSGDIKLAGSSNGHSSAQEPQVGTQDAAGIEDAIRKAQEALAAAETSLGSIHKLRSAQPPNKWAGLLQVLRSVAIAGTAGALLVASHAFGLGWQWAGATIGALALAAQAYRQQTITESAAVAVAVASLTTFGCSLRFGLVLLAFSYTSCKLRQFKEAMEVQDVSHVPNAAAAAVAQQQQGQQEQQHTGRDWLEIVCIAAVPTILAIAYGAMAGCLDLPLGSLPNVETWRADLLTLLQGAVLGWYACCCGDAWSSELGALSADQPRLLTTLQPVRKGTHGGVTLLGLSGAAAGGLLVGLVFYCAAVLSPTLWVFEAQRAAAMAQWRLIPLGLMAGLCGSLLDSLFGAALQFTGYDLSTSSLTSTPGPAVKRISGLRLHWVDNNVVNVLAASVTAALTALAALATFG